MSYNKINYISSFLKLNLLSTTFLILFHNIIYCQEFNDSLPPSDILQIIHFKKVHRDTIYKVERNIYINKDTCLEEYFVDMVRVLKKCPSSETILLKYVREKSVWTSINTDKIIEKGKFRKSKMSFWDDLVRTRRRLPKNVEKYGEWISFYPDINKVITIIYLNGHVVIDENKQLNDLIQE